MHTSKPFPYRPTVIARQDKPLPRPVALPGDKPHVVTPHDHATDARPFYAGEFLGPHSGYPQVAVIIDSEVAHKVTTAPRQPRPSGAPSAPSHPALPPLTEGFYPRVRAHCPVGMGFAVLALLAGALVAFGVLPRGITPPHVAVDTWCASFPAGLSCKQNQDSKK